VVAVAQTKTHPTKHQTTQRGSCQSNLTGRSSDYTLLTTRFQSSGTDSWTRGPAVAASSGHLPQTNRHTDTQTRITPCPHSTPPDSLNAASARKEGKNRNNHDQPETLTWTHQQMGSAAACNSDAKDQQSNILQQATQPHAAGAGVTKCVAATHGCNSLKAQNVASLLHMQ
jgi:hypothetical protein